MKRGALGYLLVLVGGLITSPLPASSPVAALPLLEPLRSTMPGRMLGLAVVMAGLGLAAAAWLRLVRAVTASSAPWQERVAEVRLHAVTWSLPLLLAPPLFSRDGWSYAAQGQLAGIGLSPYTWSPSILTGPIVEAVDPRWMGSLAPYGPVPLVWGSIASHVTHDPWLLVIAHRLLAVVGLALLAYAVPRLALRARVDPAVASAVALASPLMLAHGIGGVHNDVVMAGLMCLALVLALEGRWVVAALAVGAAVAVKVPAVFLVVGVVLATLPTASRLPARIWRSAAVGCLALGTVVLIGYANGLGLGWVKALGTPGEVRTPLSLTTDLGMLASVASSPLGLTTTDAVSLARTCGSIAAVLLAGWLLLRARSGDARSVVRTSALLMAGIVVLSPVVHPWYLLWCLPLLAAAPVGERGARAVLHLSWLLGLIAPLDSSLEGAWVEISLTAGIAVVVAILLARPPATQAGTTRERRRRSLEAAWSSSIAATVRDHG